MASIRIDASWLDALDRHVNGMYDDILSVYAEVADELHERIVDRARNHPKWNEYADRIESWDENGHLAIGIQNPEYVSEAFALEYGDESAPPAPLFRSAESMSSIEKFARDRMIYRRGYDAVKRGKPL
jgi:hypothetical protein